jgi:MFS family permease
MNASTLPIEAGALFEVGRRSACIGAVALVSLLAFEAIAVAVAMPAIAGALDGLALYALAFGGMLATSILGMVAAGEMCDRDGPLQTTAIGLAVFTAGLLVAGLATSMGWVVSGRIVQGLGGGMLGVALYVGMGQLLPQSLHPRLFALFAGAWAMPALVGPLAAAWLVEHFGWRAVFLTVAAVVPVCAAVLLPAFGRLPMPARSAARPAYARGPLIWAAIGALSALMLHAASHASAPAPMLTTLAVGLIAASLAAGRMLPKGSLVAANGLPSVIALRGMLAAAFATAEVFLPLYLTREQGWSLAHAGLTLSAAAICWSFGSAVQTRIAGDRARLRALQAGFGGVALGISLVALQIHIARSGSILVAGWAVAGLGIGLSFPMLSVLTLRLSAPGAQGRNASALQLSDALCSSAALALAGALFSAAGGSGAPGYLLVFALALALACSGALLSRRAFG